MKIHAATPPTQRNADSRVPLVLTPRFTLENATRLGTEVPVRAAFSKEVQGLFPCVLWALESIKKKWAVVPMQSAARTAACM
ncbi:unnamed protein product [Staurois parvus]|uniref:Uncharacterized protein n=1 Tax=Staurois parvus TaxID=386267 RepID=A0ABN9EEY1_9NEOB|nr:unnamed protein product [Staurois parvus]